MRHSDDESPPASLRGRLAEVYLPALLSETTAPLMRRLGGLATIDEPVWGASEGEKVEAHIQKIAAWLGERSARYSKSGTIVGADRDVSEGVLDVRVDGKQLALPIAVVAQRGKNRQIDMRTYHATRSIGVDRKGPAPSLAQETITIPAQAKEVVDALRTHDMYALSTALEHDGSICDALGRETERDGLSSLIDRGSFVFEVRAVADDLRSCGLECVRPSGRASLIVVQRGESGLIRSVRIYDED